MKIRRLWAVAKKEFIHIRRDPRSLAMAVLVPVILLILFGYALTLDVKNVPMVVWDQSRTPASRELVSRFSGSAYFSLISHVNNYEETQRAVDSGQAVLALIVPVDFAKKVGSGRPASVQIILDGTDANTAILAKGYAEAITQMVSENILVQRLEQQTGGTFEQPVDYRPRVWYNAELESRNTIIPGLIGVILMVIAALLTSLTVSREWETGTMEQILVSPIRPMEFILGKTIPFAAIGFFDMFLVLIVGILVFDIPFRGSLLLLISGTALYLLTIPGLGLLISTISRTQRQAMLSMFFFFMPAILLSGFMFPIANMPEVVQWLTYLNPLRYFMEIIRGIFLKGVGLEILWFQMVCLAVMGTLIITLAAGRFRKTLA